MAFYFVLMLSILGVGDYAEGLERAKYTLRHWAQGLIFAVTALTQFKNRGTVRSV
jgi:hypothetical protein